jgi:hypothetical protein
MRRPRRATATPTSGTRSFEAQLWATANARLGLMDAADYKHVPLGLTFLKYVSDSFEEHGAYCLHVSQNRRSAAGGRMPTPDFQSLMLPLLEPLGDRQEQSVRDVIAAPEDEVRLTGEERKCRIGSGQEPVFYNRARWAKTYPKKTGLLENPCRGWLRITERAIEVLKRKPERMDVNLLKQFEELRACVGALPRMESTDETAAEGEVERETPQGLLA